MSQYPMLTRISIVPFVILVGIAKAWKKDVFSGPKPVFCAGRTTSRGANAPALAGAATYGQKSLSLSHMFVTCQQITTLSHVNKSQPCHMSSRHNFVTCLQITTVTHQQPHTWSSSLRYLPMQYNNFAGERDNVLSFFR